MKRTWTFYTTDMNGIDTIVSTVNCIKPDKTKIWKLLVFCAEAEENTAIKEIGYY